MKEVSTVGLDLAKNVFHVHGVDREEKVVVSKRLRRSQMMPFFRKLPPCLVGMEACATSHHWARQLQALGHTVRIMPANYVKPYVKRNKNDARDAAAICEAVTRPTMRFVAVKSPEQQSLLMVHRTRALLVRQRTMLVNAMRAHLAEFGIVAPVGRMGVKALVAVIADRQDGRLPDLARRNLESLIASLMTVSQEITEAERHLLAWHRSNLWRQFPASGRLSPLLWLPRWPTLRSSNAVGSWRLGSGWCRNRTAPPARRVSVGSPNRVIPICDGCLSPAPWWSSARDEKPTSRRCRGWLI